MRAPRSDKMVTRNQQIAIDFQHGSTPRYLAKQHEISVTRVYAILAAQGVDLNLDRAIRNQKIFDAWKAGEPPRAISKLMHLSLTAVREVLRDYRAAAKEEKQVVTRVKQMRIVLDDATLAAIDEQARKEQCTRSALISKMARIYLAYAPELRRRR